MGQGLQTSAKASIVASSVPSSRMPRLNQEGTASPDPTQTVTLEIKAGPGGQGLCPGRSLPEDAAILEVERQLRSKCTRRDVVRAAKGG